LRQVSFEGTIYTGKGVGKNFVALPWVTAQIEAKLGFSPYQGTLNLRLTEESKEKRKLLDPERGIMVQPQTGYLPGVLLRAAISGLECAIVLPLVPNYPNDLLEVISPLFLRGKLGLSDGKKVTVWVTLS
jgi:riboflavin kinase